MAGGTNVIVVDSVVWADYFNGHVNPWTEHLDRALAEEEDIAIHPIIVTEVLMGFRSESGFRRARNLLLSLPILALSVQGHVRAARLFRRLRVVGVTVRGAIDCTLAQTCIESGGELLSCDLDFERIATHSRLRLWRP